MTNVAYHSALLHLNKIQDMNVSHSPISFSFLIYHNISIPSLSAGLRCHINMNCVTFLKGKKNSYQMKPLVWSPFCLKQQGTFKPTCPFFKLNTIAVTLAKTSGLQNLASVSSHAFFSSHVMILWCSSKLLSTTESCDRHFYCGLQTPSQPIMHHLNWAAILCVSSETDGQCVVKDPGMIADGSVFCYRVTEQTNTIWTVDVSHRSFIPSKFFWKTPFRQVTNRVVCNN